MQQEVIFSPGVNLSYDTLAETMELKVAPGQSDSLHLLNSEAGVRDFFSELVLQWSRLTSNRRVFWLIYDAGFTVAPGALQVWTEQIDFIAQVTAKGVFVIGTGQPSNTVMKHAQRYATRAEAISARDRQAKNVSQRSSLFHVDTVRRCRNGVTLSFDTKYQIVEITVPPKPEHKRYFLETDDEIEAHVKDVRNAWLSGARGQKVYFLINYQNFDVNPACSQVYVERVNEFFAKSSLAMVRFNANLLQSTTIRHTVAKGAAPANLYKERADALAVVEALKDGRVQFSLDESPGRRQATCVCGVTLVYDRASKVMEVTAPRVDLNGRYLLETAADVRRYLQEITLAWTEMTGSKPVYWLVNYEHFTINPAIRPVFDAEVADLMRAAAVKLVRYNASIAQKIALRRTSVRDGSTANLYASRNEALEAIRSL